MDKITYSEIFRSLQGEGMYTGRNTVWLRFFGCNLNCSGFGQKDPTDPSTYELPYKDFDISTITKIEDLPVWSKGCDSSYSWSKKFKHLNYQGTAEEISNKIIDLLKSDINPSGTFLHDKSQMETHLCFTGGEPLIPANQKAIIEILTQLSLHQGGIIPGTTKHKGNNFPRYVTFETNGTKELTPEFLSFMRNHNQYIRIMFSVSPKLFTVSGEKNDKAIKPETVKSYITKVSSKGQLKFVLGTEDKQWNELDEVVTRFRNAGIHWPVYIMPVGALEEDQQKIAAKIADRALANGYHVAARVHAYIYGNALGT